VLSLTASAAETAIIKMITRDDDDDDDVCTAADVADGEDLV